MPALPNQLPQEKGEYIKALSWGKSHEIVQMAFVFYHCEVPLEDAKRHIQTYVDKTTEPKEK